MLLHRGNRYFCSKLFDVGGDNERRQQTQFDFVFSTPSGKPVNRSGICQPGVSIADVGCQELDVAKKRFAPVVKEQRGEPADTQAVELLVIADDDGTAMVGHRPVSGRKHHPIKVVMGALHVAGEPSNLQHNSSRFGYLGNPFASPQIR